MRLIIFTFLLFVSGICLHAQEAPLLELKDGMQPVSMGPYLELYEDASAAESFDEIRASAKFKPGTSDFPNFDITSSAVWVRFRLRNNSGQEWLIQCLDAMITQGEFYEPDSAGNYSRRSFSLADRARDREFKGSLMLQSLHLRKGETKTYYYRLLSEAPLQVNFKAGSKERFFTFSSRYHLLNGLYYGLILLMIMYNLFLFVTNRDRVYIYYVLYAAGNGLFMCYLNGFQVYMPSFVSWILLHHPSFMPANLGLFSCLFTLRFLDSKTNTPKLHRVFVWMMIITMSLVVALSLAGFSRESLRVIQVSGMMLSVLGLLTGIVVYKKGYKPAAYYLLGFGVYLISLLVYILSDLGAVPFNTFTHNGLMAGSAFELFILSFAIGDKINRFKKEKEKAQLAALEAAQENERIVREQNTMLEQKVNERTQEIRLQKTIIEEKNKDILDSLHYAKRIQRALLASDSLLQKNLPEHFVLYKPKDIVSGDFYWGAETENGKFLLLTGDCTGHGVPGAFMSLLNISILHELVTGMKRNRPDEILNMQRDAIVMALNPEGSEEVSRDGMDCSLCSFDLRQRKMEFACANNPVWIFRNGEIIASRPDKFPVGIHEGEKQPFTLQQTELLPGDIIYAFTDGFADQFGGPKGKKFKYSQLKEKLLAIHSLPMNEQKEKLEKIFDDWRGNLEQVDDVLVIGIRI